MRRSLPAALLLLAIAAPLGAQIIRPGGTRSSEPQWIGSLGVGFADPGPMSDGESRANWFFDSGFNFRASIERALRNEASIGVVATYGRFPLDYERFEPILDDVVCGDRCAADADIVSAHGLFHIGGGVGLHQIIELQAGVTNYRNFQTRDGSTLAPENDTDFSFGAGYGIGFGFSRSLSLSIIQEFAVALHGDDGSSNDGSSSGSSSWIRTNVFRVGLRYGVGSIPRL
jgi:hypothetical protein